MTFVSPITSGRRGHRRLKNALRSTELNARHHRTTSMRFLVRGQIMGDYVVYVHIAAQAKGVLQPKIWKCCNGEASHTHGLRWEYAE